MAGSCLVDISLLEPESKMPGCFTPSLEALHPAMDKAVDMASLTTIPLLSNPINNTVLARIFK